MLYELRVYHILPGKMEDVQRRFSDYTMDMFKKHNIKVVDFWEDADGNNVLYYLTEFPDRETRDQCMNAFVNDPEWKAIKAKSEENGKLIERMDSYFMKRTPYSPQA